jgi:methionine synthase II (cobalamin-independent)
VGPGPLARGVSHARGVQRALVPVLRAELLAVRAAGITVAQFDDPHLCLLVDPKVRAGFADPGAEAALCT